MFNITDKDFDEKNVRRYLCRLDWFYNNNKVKNCDVEHHGKRYICNLSALQKTTNLQLIRTERNCLSNTIDR